MYNKLTCLFGHHDYSRKLTKDKDGHYMHLCKICKRSGHYKYSDGDEVWCSYDEKGEMIYVKWGGGLERWKNSDGDWVSRPHEIKVKHGA